MYLVTMNLPRANILKASIEKPERKEEIDIYLTINEFSLI